jgi:hypothetical protein
MPKIPLDALERLIASVEELRRGAVDFEGQRCAELEAVPPEHRDSARNLVHYLALRQLVLVTLEAVLSALQSHLHRLGRTECVMLNKGPHVVEAVEFLKGVLERMDAHQSKKTALLRRLSVSESPEVGRDCGGTQAVVNREDGGRDEVHS